MASARVALASARTYLNDDAAISWTDAVLFAKLQEAHRELVMALDLNGIPVISAQSASVIVPAGTTTIPAIATAPAPSLPAGLVEPIMLLERPSGSTDPDEYQEMTQVPFTPELDPIAELIYWCWSGEQIGLTGATSDRDVVIRFRKRLTEPLNGEDALGFMGAETFLGPRTAALALISIGDNRWKDYQAQAELALNRLINMNVNGMQWRGVRRLPYRRGKVWRVPR